MKEIILNNWQNGISKSAYLGFEEITGLNVYDELGACFVNYRPANDSSTTVTDKINFMIGAYQVGSGVWAVDDSNDFYNSSGSWSKDKNLSGTGGTGIVEWKGYLLAIRPTNISYSSDGTNWTDAWEDLDNPKNGNYNNSSQHMAIVGQDDKVYIANDNFITTIEEVDGQDFDPSDSGTYTFTQEALSLPENNVVTCISELGRYLAMGTHSRANPNKGYVYLWDRTSTSFEIPVIIEERGVNAMITTQNRLYIQAGSEGSWYISEGTTAQKFAEIPNTLVSNKDDGIYVRPGAVMMGSDGLIKFGLSQIGSGNNQSPMAVYSLDPNSGALTIENEISTGNTGSSSNVSVTALYNAGNYVYYYGWQDGTSYGIDKINTSRRVTSYGARIVSSWLNIGNKRVPTILKEYEIHLSRPLGTDEGIKIWYRTEQGGSWTQWGDTITGTEQEYIGGTNISISSGVQIKIELTTPSGNANSPRLYKVILRYGN